MISAIVCVDNNWGIGRNNDLLIHIPEDLRKFKEYTNNSIIVMGRKTWDSLPKKPLSNRLNIVITSSVKGSEIQSDGSIFANMKVVKDWLSLPDTILKNIFIIGGASIYNEFLDYCERIYVTHVDYSFEDVDTYFPNLSLMPQWKITSSSDVNEYNEVKYKFCIYSKKEW